MIHLKLTIMALLWAGGFISSKIVTQEAGPFTISFMRFFIVTCIMSLLLYKDQESIKFDRKLFLDVMLAAFLGVFCYNYFFYAGIKDVNASKGSVIISTVPIVVMIISFFCFKEQMGKFKVLGVIFSVFGAWIVVTEGNIGSIFVDAFGKGEFLLVLSVFCGAAFAIYSKQILKKCSPMVTMLKVSLFGAAFLFLPAMHEMSQASAMNFSTSFFVNLLYLCIGPSVIAVTFYYEAINAVGTSRASQYMNLIPVFAVVLSIIFLQEQVNMSLLLGGGLVTSGLFLTNITS